MKALIFIDLDDTLFQTPRKCPPEVTLLPATSDLHGGIGSYMTHVQRSLFERLRQDSLIVPTTARDTPAFRRVHLEFQDVVILNNGATILQPDGTLDTLWAAHIATALEGVHLQMQAFLEEALLFAEQQNLGVKIYPICDAAGSLVDHSAHNPTHNPVSDAAQPLYLVSKHPQKDLHNLERVKAFWQERLEQTGADFYLTSNDNNVALLPNCINKRAAVAYVLNNKRAEDQWLTLGIGDSLSDLGFMDLCDFWITPRGSQIASRLKM
jgi:hydroxymethylpyrimidine pyrophosphatase-like HAD family hydrolase